MTSLGDVIKKSKPKRFPCMLGELAGFKAMPDGRDAIIVRRLDDSLKAGETILITQGKAPTEELSLRRNTIESFRNPNSKHFMPVGSILQFDQVTLADDEKSAEAMFIKSMYEKDANDPRSILIGYARPLPSRKNKETAWIEIMQVDKKRTASSPKEFSEALALSWRDSMMYTSGSGISEYSKNIIILTDDDNSKPHQIFIKNVPINPNDSPVQYRYPRLEELKKQFQEDEAIQQISAMLLKGKGNTKINVLPGARVLVPASKAQEKRYGQTIKNYTGRYKINKGANSYAEEETIGYKKSVIGLWNGVVNLLTPLLFERPRLNEQEESIAIQPKPALNRAKISEEKSKLEDASAAAAAAMAAIAAQSVTNEAVLSQAPENSSYDEQPPVHDEAPPYLNSDEGIDDFFDFAASDEHTQHYASDDLAADDIVDYQSDEAGAASIFDGLNIG